MYLLCVFQDFGLSDGLDWQQKLQVPMQKGQAMCLQDLDIRASAILQ